jgi:signal peptidase I
MADEHIGGSSQHVPPGAPPDTRHEDRITPAPGVGANGDARAPAAPPAPAPAGQPRSIRDVAGTVWEVIWPSASPAVHQTESVREVVETVVFVVVLVLLLKSFAAEAFVIPTGSMAETLWGYQKVVTCPECGYQFPVNCSQEVDPQNGPPVPVTGCTCPNCRFHIDRDHMPAGWSSGDRVLVAKSLFEPLFGFRLMQPERTEVVVFKYPGNSDPNSGAGPEFPESGPQKNQIPMNYIKRCTGLGGETIGIWYGKLYVSDNFSYDDLGLLKKIAESPLSELKRMQDELREEERKRTDAQHLRDGQVLLVPQELKNEIERRTLLQEQERGPLPAREDSRLQELERHHAWLLQNMSLVLWRKEFMHQVDPMALEQLKSGKFKIVRKKPSKVLAQRRIVYDNDHSAKDLEKTFPARWAGEGAAWTADDARGFRFAPQGTGLSWLRYSNLLRTSPLNSDGKPQPVLITDFMGYNTYEPGHGGSSGQNWVGDLMLECEVTADQAGGEFVMELSKGVDRFQAHWDLSSGICTLSRLTKDKPEQQLDSKPTALKGGTHRLRFANVDERLLVWVDGSLPFGDGVTYSAPERRGPVADNDLHPANIAARGEGVSVHHLKLWRDTYYTLDPHNGSDSGLSGDDWAKPEKWSGLDNLPANTLYVQPGHYLCMGDNSPESSDGRSWGLVPERLMLGRALLVYYPFYCPVWPLESPVNRVGPIE